VGAVHHLLVVHCITPTQDYRGPLFPILKTFSKASLEEHAV